MNYENTFTFVKSYDGYWSKEIEVMADYEASTWKKKELTDMMNSIYYI